MDIDIDWLETQSIHDHHTPLSKIFHFQDNKSIISGYDTFMIHADQLLG